MQKYALKMTLASIGLFIATTAGIVLLKAIPVMLLWNWLIPKLFGLTRINYFEATGICLFINILTISVNIKAKSHYA